MPLELREAVANLYNVTYRKGKASQYTYENVCIVPGGRAGLSRIAAVIGDVYCVRNNTSIISITHVSRNLPSPTKFLTTRHMTKSCLLSSASYRSQLRRPQLNPMYSPHAHTLPLFGSLEPEVSVFLELCFPLYDFLQNRYGLNIGQVKVSSDLHLSSVRSYFHRMITLVRRMIFAPKGSP
jgi:hypothetical protein